jgi:hypothetical protein
MEDWGKTYRLLVEQRALFRSILTNEQTGPGRPKRTRNYSSCVERIEINRNWFRQKAKLLDQTFIQDANTMHSCLCANKVSTFLFPRWNRKGDQKVTYCYPDLPNSLFELAQLRPKTPPWSTIPEKVRDRMVVKSRDRSKVRVETHRIPSLSPILSGKFKSIVVQGGVATKVEPRCICWFCQK